MTAARIVHVAVAVIRDERGRVLVAQRLPHQHLAGLWEFPGGKVEAGETLAEGMRREILEELGIQVEELAPLLRIEHTYPEKTVLLDVWRILQWSGPAPDAQGGIGREGQPLRWVHPADMVAAEFPPADVPVINALQLPPLYAISPDIDDAAGMHAFVEAMALAQATLLQVRLKENPAIAPELITQLRARVPAARILLNSDTHSALRRSENSASLFGADGLHLTARALQDCRAKPANFCAASCHDVNELAQAYSLGLDFVTLSPVLPTSSHAGVAPMGWQVFSALAIQAGLPVYALGGLNVEQFDEACRQGAIGIAGISAFTAREPR